MVGLVRIKLRASALYRRLTVLVELTNKRTNQLNIQENSQLTKPSTVTNQTMKLLLLLHNLNWNSSSPTIPSLPLTLTSQQHQQQKTSPLVAVRCFSTWWRLIGPSWLYCRASLYQSGSRQRVGDTWARWGFRGWFPVSGWGGRRFDIVEGLRTRGC